MLRKLINYIKSKFTKTEIEVPCSAEQDWEWHYESE